MYGSALPTTETPQTRRQIRAAERAQGSSRDGSRSAARPDRHVRSTSHMLTLGIAGALAVVLPITGLTGMEVMDSAVAQVRPVETGPNVLATLDAAGAATSLEAGEPGSLMAVPDAPARAAEAQASRAAEREALAVAEAAVAEAAAAEAAAAEAAAAEAAAAEARRVVMPIAADAYRHTSGYGGRVDPLGRGNSFHLGTDLAAPRDTPIHAVAAGTVTHAGAGKDGRSSNLVIIEHEIDGEKYSSWYVHMYDDGVYVQPGQQVRAGDVIGGVGSNGNSTGNHLHFEIHLADDTTVEPLAWLAERGAV